MIASNLSKLLKKRRQASGLTQTEVAKKLHVSRQAISNWETGRHLPDLILIDQLANIYGISIDELINDNPPKNIENPVKRTYPLLILAILITSRLTIASSSRSLLIMDGLILLSIGLFNLTKLKKLKLQVALQLISLMTFLICTFKSNILSSFSFQTTTFIVCIILSCQLCSTYHYFKKRSN
ncbi:helix-turn-helix transcriptional regulator [Ligilactobacillus sp. WILCCON 0076]|uniref:Helix-turn-helix transcriptional regulator n=1 Tax=Ligilactobacillus ubinensis TaxID=2876789 RepID=A0A9X2FPS5_9LACO|nr:helix-turn-helix transcriptional regulator [Ligilactobacillus ubinensis]MCP0887373.1 helix-turn-helix transcriptional regulator [Ligilactobacillus ubinensis]